MADSPAIERSVFLQPGELFTGAGAARVKTVLGSCVAITMRAPRFGLAAMAHCLLPEAGRPAGAIPRREALRYVDTTIELMLRAFSTRGAGLGDLEIKLFGGADRMSHSAAAVSLGVGGRNLSIARSLLGGLGLSVAASHVGGRRGRVIEFDTASGEVFVRQLPTQNFPPIGKRP